MADNMSHNPAQTKDKVRPGAAGATTGTDDTVLERKKTPSFQITSVTVATRVSNDGGDDSADDLDDSRTDDISEVVDVDGSTSMSVSRLTDLETPSFSEESFSKEDVFFNTTTTALGCAPVIPTSSQYGLAIVANLEGDNPSTSSPVNCISTVSANDVHVSVSVAEANSKQSETDSSHSHPGRNERFKVVKIESTEPFKRGRWMCMDYLDHTTQQQPQSQPQQQPHLQQQAQHPPQAQPPQQLQPQQLAQQQQHTIQPLQQPQMQPQVTLVQHTLPKTDCNDVITSNMGMSPYQQDPGVMMNDSIVKNVGPDDHQGSVLDPSVIAQMANSMIAPVSSPDQHQQAMLASQRHQVAQQSMAMGQMATSTYQTMPGQSLPHVAIPSSQAQQVVMQGQQMPQTMPQQMTQSFQPQASSATGMPQQILQPQHPQSMTQVPYQPQSLPQQQLQHVIQVHQQQYQQQAMPQMQQLQQQNYQQQMQQQQLLQQQSQQQLQHQQHQQLQQMQQQHQMQQQQMQQQQLQQQQMAAAMQQQQQQQQAQQQHQVHPQVPQQPPHSAAQHPVMSQVVQQQTTHMSAPTQQSQYYSPPQGSIIQPKVVTIQAQNQAAGYPTQTSMTVTQTQNVNSTTHLPAMSQGASMPQQSMPQSMAQAQSMQAQSLQAQSLQAQLPPQQHQHQQHPHQQPLQMAGQALSQMQTLGQGQSLPQNLTSSSVPQPAPQQQQIPHQQLAGQSMPQMQTIAAAQSLPQGVPQGVPSQSVPQSAPHQQLNNQLPPLQTMAQVQNLPQSISQSSVPQPAPQQGQMGMAPQPMMPMQMQQSQGSLLAAQQQQQQQQPQPQQHYPMASNASPQVFSNPAVSSSATIMSPHSGGSATVATSGVSSVVDPVTGTVLGTVNNPVELQSGQGVVSSSQNGSGTGPANALLESLVEATNAVDDVAPGNTDDTESASGTNAVAIDNKIEQAMDLVKSHLMFAVREEVEVLKEKIAELMDRISQLELENSILKAHATQETLAQLNSSGSSNIQPQGQQGSVSQGQSQQTPPQSTQPPQHQNGS